MTAAAGFEVIVLAAGRGSRLGALGEETPKWLLEVGDATIADRQLEALRQAEDLAPGQVGAVTVVTGHAADRIEDFLAAPERASARALFNPDYARLNNWYSVLHALDSQSEPRDGVVIMNGDLYAEPEWLAAFFADALTTPRPSLIAVDTARTLTDESMKVSVTQAPDGSGAVLREIGKTGVGEPIGEYVGLLMARGEALREFADALRSFVGRAEAGDAWYERAVGETAAAGTEWWVWPTPGSRWVEIDDDADHAQAVAMAAQRV